LPNLLELSYFFELGEIGLGSHETFRIWLSLKKLVDKYPLESIRFWGKLFGINANYYVAEVQFQEGKDELEEEGSEEEKRDEEDIKDMDEDMIPKAQYKPLPKPPKEDSNIGCNKYIYFVCNSRKLRRLFK
jgi:radial spoke head protein 4/6